MRSLDELVAHAARDLDDRYDVDAGLDAVLSAIEQTASPAEAARTARREVRQRIRALKTAGNELDHLRERIAYLGRAIPFLEEGWPEEQGRLEHLLLRASTDGLAEWLDRWFTAAGSRRTAALARLGTIEGFPLGASLLSERCAGAIAGLDAGSWLLSHAMLELGASGVTVGARTVPSPAVRQELRLLLARLALHEGLWEEADRAIARAEAVTRSPATAALRARLHRLGGLSHDVEHTLDIVEADGVSDLDVACELIAEAWRQQEAELALDIGRSAVESLPVLLDIDAEIARLVSDPPAELWGAIAERALHDRELTLFEHAADMAEMSATDDAFVLLAAVSELRAEAAVASGANASERANALLIAGSYRMDSGQFDVALEDFEATLELDPENVDASLRLADCLVVRAKELPLAAGAADIQEALDRVAAARQDHAITDDNAWSHLVEAEGRRALAEGVRFDRFDQLWRAILAACRGVAHRPGLASAWVGLADTTTLLDISSMPLVFAEHAATLEPADQSAVAVQVQILTNAGRFDEALARIGGSTDPWYIAVKAYIDVVRGDPWSAVRALRASQPNPEWGWVSELLVCALLLAHRGADARAEAERTLALWSERTDEYAGAHTTALMQVVLNRPADALRTLEAVPSFDVPESAHHLRGAALVLRGEVDAGVRALNRAVDAASLVGDLCDIRSLFLPVLGITARQADVGVPSSIEAIEERLAARIAEREKPAQPLAELAAVPSNGVDPDVTRSVKQMLTAFTHALVDDVPAALTVLDEALVDCPDDPDLTAARNWAADDDRADSPTDVAVALHGPTEHEVPGVIERPITLELPPSWFVDCGDPENQHPLFLEYLPAMRAATDRPIPPINVHASDDLEPDGFAISLRGALIERGQIDPAGRYFRPQARELLGEPSAVRIPTLGLWRLPETLDSETEGLSTLLTMSATEAIARRIPEALRDAEAPERLNEDPITEDGEIPAT